MSFSILRFCAPLALAITNPLAVLAQLPLEPPRAFPRNAPQQSALPAAPLRALDLTRRHLPARDAPLLAQAGHGADPHAGHGAAATASPLRIDEAWTRATPGGAKVAGGFLRITNTGDRPDRLISASSEIAQVVELHEMRHEGGTMKMRALENGLELKPGETVELKPGGYHIMFIDLKAPIKQGDLIRAALKFERAGTLQVEFKAGAMGGGAPKAGHGH